MNWLKKVAAYGLLCALPALVGGCWGKCTSDLLSADKRAYFMDFKAGDYWIYRNVQNGDLDSVYFVSQTVRSENTTPSCLQEHATIELKGFAKTLTYSYIVQGWDGNVSIDIKSAIGFYGDYDINAQTSERIVDKNYPRVVSALHCCIAGSSCSNFCDGTYMRFNKLTFARSVGLVKWEAIRHPKFDTVTYELIRSNRL